MIASYTRSLSALHRGATLDGVRRVVARELGGHFGMPVAEREKVIKSRTSLSAGGGADRDERVEARSLSRNSPTWGLKKSVALVQAPSRAREGVAWGALPGGRAVG